MAVAAMETDERTRALGEHLLLQTYLFEVLVPIFYEKPDGKFDAIGTGTLLEIGDRLFIVTAAHVLDGCEGERLWSPWDRKAGTFGQCGTHSYLTPKNANRLDVATVEIEFPETIAAFRKNYRLLNLAQITAPTPGRTHILAGYPECMTDTSGQMIHQQPLAYHTELLDGEPKGWVDYYNPAQDLFFRLEQRGELFSGEPHDVPKLNGASGCVIWEKSPYEGPLWTPQKELKAVGILRSAKPGDGWFRATRWLPIVGLILQFDRRAGAELAVSLLGEARALELIEEVWPEEGLPPR